MMLGNYIEVDGWPVHEPDIKMWGQWMAVNADTNQVAHDLIGREISVSTVFLGIDHSFTCGEPILYETMVFGGECNEFQHRYTTREQALAGHKAVVEEIKKHA